jgi:hypothetical protein
MQARGLFWQPSADEHHCTNPASSIPRAYGGDQMYLQSLRSCHLSTISFDLAVVEYMCVVYGFGGMQLKIQTNLKMARIKIDSLI